MTEVTKTEASTEDGVKDSRSIRFPSLSLGESIKIIKEAGKYGRQHGVDAMAGYAGHQTANSGPFRQKLSSLREWGLVAKTDGKVTLTDLAMGIAHPTTEDASVDVLAAFRKCELFWNLYETKAKNVSLKISHLANSAVTERGVSVGAKDKFMKSFLESAETAGLAEQVGNDEVRFLPVEENEQKKSVDNPASDDAQALQDDPGAEGQVPPVDPRGKRPVVNQVWDDDDYQIVVQVRSKSSLPVAAFGKMGTLMGNAEALWNLLHGEDAAPAEGDDDGTPR